jgi:hypothetical protein
VCCQRTARTPEGDEVGDDLPPRTSGNGLEIYASGDDLASTAVWTLPDTPTNLLSSHARKLSLCGGPKYAPFELNRAADAIHKRTIPFSLYAISWTD